MKTAHFLLTFALVASNCSDSKSSKPAPIDPPKVVELDETNPVPSASPTPTPVPTVASTPAAPIVPVKSKSTFSLFTLPAQESSLVRSAAKVVSVSINPLKVTSFASLNSSLVTAKCGTEVLTQSEVVLLTEDRENEPVYRPSIVIPADFLCTSEITVTLDVYGFDVELGDVIVADVVSVGKATVLQ